MHKVKVCHLADHITGKADGIFTHILQIVKYTDLEKFEHFLCYQGGDLVQSRFKQIGNKTFVLNSINKKFPFRAVNSFIKICRKENFDIIHTHFLKPYVISSLLKPFLGYKVIYNYHGTFIRNKFNTRFQQTVYRILHWLICKLKIVEIAIAPSVESKRILFSETKLFPKIEVYYNCSEIIQTQKNETTEISRTLSKLKENKLLIGVIARLFPEKRIDLVLQIAKNFNTDVHFVFCGDGELFDDMLKYAHTLRIENSVTFLGFVPNVDKLLGMFDLILFTSDYEGLPLTLWEAMGSGVPIVSTNVGGIGEIIDQEKCGILFPKGDVEKGVDALSKLVKNAKLRNELGNNGLNAVKNKYTPEQFGKQIEDIYERVLNA